MGLNFLKSGKFLTWRQVGCIGAGIGVAAAGAYLWYRYKGTTTSEDPLEATPAAVPATLPLSASIQTLELCDLAIQIHVYMYLEHIREEIKSSIYNAWGEFWEYPLLADEMEGILVIQEQKEIPNHLYENTKYLYLIDKELFERKELLDFVNKILEESIMLDRDELCIDKLLLHRRRLIEEFNNRKAEVCKIYTSVNRYDANLILQKHSFLN